MEWTIVTVLIALVSFGAVVIKPIVSLTSTISRLTTIVDVLQKDMEIWSTKNNEAHSRIWEHNDKQDVMLNSHEIRLGKIEGGK